ncbi:hypothetical protein D3C84_677810 [compost metagenome]
MGKHHAQRQEQIGQRCPLLIAVAEFAGFVRFMQVIHDLPDPGGRPGGSPQEGQGNIEEQPCPLLERCPTPFSIGDRLPVCQCDQRIGVGGEHCLQRRFRKGGSPDGDSPHHAQCRGGVDQPLRKRPDGGQFAGEDILGIVEIQVFRQPGQDRVT